MASATATASCRRSSARSGGAVSLHAGTLYRALARLLESELIEELTEAPDPKNDDERRRYYRLTARGIAVAESEGARLEGSCGRSLAATAERCPVTRRRDAPGASHWRCSPIPAPSAGDSATKCATTSVAGPLARPARYAHLGTLAINGLAERWSAVVRWAWFSNATPHFTSRQAGTHMFWDTLRADVRHTIRLAVKTPVFTTFTILTLALGIGATSAIFAVINGVLLRALPYRDDARLVNVWSNNTRRTGRAIRFRRRTSSISRE